MKYIIAIITAITLSACNFTLPDGTTDTLKDAVRIACKSVELNAAQNGLSGAIDTIKASGLQSIICDAIIPNATASTVVTVGQLEALL